MRQRRNVASRGQPPAAHQSHETRRKAGNIGETDDRAAREAAHRLTDVDEDTGPEHPRQIVEIKEEYVERRSLDGGQAGGTAGHDGTDSADLAALEAALAEVARGARRTVGRAHFVASQLGDEALDPLQEKLARAVKKLRVGRLTMCDVDRIKVYYRTAAYDHLERRASYRRMLAALAITLDDGCRRVANDNADPGKDDP